MVGFLPQFVSMSLADQKGCVLLFRRSSGAACPTSPTPLVVEAWMSGSLLLLRFLLAEIRASPMVPDDAMLNDPYV